MAGRLAVQLTESLQIVDRKVVAGEVQQSVLQHRAMAVRKDEAVAAGPLRIRRIETKVTRPEGRRDIGHAHGHARVTGLGFLDGVHAEGTDRVGHHLSRGLRGHSISVSGLKKTGGKKPRKGKAATFPKVCTPLSDLIYYFSNKRRGPTERETTELLSAHGFGMRKPACPQTSHPVLPNCDLYLRPSGRRYKPRVFDER